MSLNTRKKRKKEIREEYIEQDGLIFQLPQEILLHLFKYFSTEELILVAGLVYLGMYLIDQYYPGGCEYPFTSYYRDPHLCTYLSEMKKTSLIKMKSKSRRTRIREKFSFGKDIYIWVI